VRAHCDMCRRSNIGQAIFTAERMDLLAPRAGWRSTIEWTSETNSAPVVDSRMISPQPMNYSAGICSRWRNRQFARSHQHPNDDLPRVQMGWICACATSFAGGDKRTRLLFLLVGGFGLANERAIDQGV
jgi:hypothetical protein